MKKIKVFALALLIGATATVSAQEKGGTETKVSEFKEGSKLSQSEIGFLDLVNNGTDSKHRGGSTATEVKFEKKTFKAGDVLTKADVKLLNDAVKAYNDKNKDIVSKEPKKDGAKSRGCYYVCWYYYAGYYYYYCC
ncbi:MAG: hypothetical protein KIS94_04940 [Chitinophagales bacterium]|nr:hypothetical protein [Chitinophagales bacterium]